MIWNDCLYIFFSAKITLKIKGEDKKMSTTNKKMYVKPSDTPTLVIKTHLDPDTNEEKNPYFTHKRDEKFEQYFKHS